jgi:1,2-phenylacetyl-CoA epoxidase catalytic subunit
VSDITSDAGSTPAVVDLLGMLAYAELLAFDRMAYDATLAPDLNRRAMLSEMAAVEIANHRRVLDRLVKLGAEPEQAMAPFRAALDAYHSQTQPSDWLEALAKAYVGDSIANDFAREVARGLSPADRDLVLEVLRESRYADFAAAEIRQALIGDESQTNRLSMWARRLVGEALTQAQRVAAERPAFTDLLANVPDAGGDVAAMLRRLTTAHTERMAAIGLNN